MLIVKTEFDREIFAIKVATSGPLGQKKPVIPHTLQASLKQGLIKIFHWIPFANTTLIDKRAVLLGIPNIYEALSLGLNNFTKLIGSCPLTNNSWALAPAM